MTTTLCQQPPTTQNLLYVLPCNTELSGDLMQTDAIGKHLRGGDRVPSQFVVLERMDAVVDDFQVLNPVVGLVAVDVVDILGGQKFATDMFGHDATVFLDDLPVEGGDSIAFGVNRSCPPMFSVTEAAAKHLGVEFDVIWMSLESLSTTRTFDGNHVGQITNATNKTEAVIRRYGRRYGLAGLMAGGGAAALGGQQRQQQQ